MTAADRLRHQVAALVANPLLRMTPGGAGLQAALASLLAWVEEVERRLAAVERVGGLPADLEAKLHQVLGHAAELGQAGGAIADADRPGGPKPGDIVGGPKMHGRFTT